jgi:hypothetical protein
VAGAGTGTGAGPGLSGGSLRKPDVTEDAEPIEDRFIEDSFFAAVLSANFIGRKRLDLSLYALRPVIRRRAARA